jgi:YidC/Oxa1 family membrane protein insertase
LGNPWTFFVIDPMTWGLNELNHITGSYALAIILFTVFIKMCLYPLTIKQLKSQRAQQALQPQLQELKAKFGDDKVKLQAETMRLYKENNANPIAGCLPTLVQFPVLIGLYNSLYAVIREPNVHASFLWVKNLALPDFWSVVPPGSTAHIYNGLFILPVLAGALQWVQQRMMMNPAANQDPQQKMMNQMMQFMPLMVIFFGFRFPAGLAIYWVTNTLVAIVQAYFIVGFGSLVLVAPWLRRFGSPRLHLSMAQPALVNADSQPRREKSGAAERRPATPARSNGRVVTKGPVSTSDAKETTGDSPPPGRNGQAKAGPGQTGNAKIAPVGGRSRPVTRKQGSKR